MESLPFSSPDEFPKPRNLSACFFGLNDRRAHSRQSSPVIGFCLIRQSSPSPIVGLNESKQVPAYNEEFRFRFCSLFFCSEVAHKDFGSGRPALLKNSGTSKINDITSHI